MKNKHIFMSLFLTLMVLPPLAMKAQDNQTTEGTDFWFTLMRADADNPEELSLTISAKNACTVTIENPTTGYRETVNMTAGGLERKVLYDGTIDHKADCYVGTADDEVNNVFKAIHVTSTDNISLFAGNWREKSFDVANLLPTASLRDEYVICAYTPSDHKNKEQGSHFAIVATEDNTIVDFVVTAATKGMPSNPGGGFIGGGSSNDVYNGKGVGDTLTTPVLKAGQVWYVWTGNNDGDDADLTGSYIKARDGKRIAVFNGNPHTNVPHKVRDRDHLYSQAMPTVYWGTKFPITGSKTTKGSNYTTFYDRQKDKVRVLAYYDGTEVYINGTLAHTFNFATNPHRYFEFELGDGTMTDPQHSSMYTVPGTSCFVETSCPTAVHMFMVSNRYDFPSSPYCNGDPAMIWMNPIEQVIDEITFGTYRDYSHFTNVVTETANVNSMTLDGNIIAGEFQALAGNSNYSFARINIPSGTHTLKGSAGFIAHVYGTGEKESYGYSAGGATKPLEQYVSINGQIFTPDTKNVLCGIDTVMFSVDLNYPTDSVVWRFGDGSPEAKGDTVYHLYGKDNIYHAQVQIYFSTGDLCGNLSTLPTRPIDIEVNTQVLDMSAKKAEPQCSDPVVTTGKARIDYVAATGLTPDTAVIRFSPAMKALGFQDARVDKQDYIEFVVPDTSGVFYADSLIFLTENCGSDTLTNVEFILSYPVGSIAQRWGDVLFVRNASSTPHGYDYQGATMQWYKNGQPIDGATGSYLYSKTYGEDKFSSSDRYSVVITKNGLSLPTCEFTPTDFSGDDNVVAVGEVFIHPSDRVTLNSTTTGSANVINSMGVSMKSNIPVKEGANSIQMPDRVGVYLLNVRTDEGRMYAFKIIVK